MGEGDQDVADIARIVADDRNAFEGIVRRWQRRLVNLAYRFCRDRALAEDMAQEAFLKAFRSLATFRAESAFSTWLMAIALNTYRSRLRAEGQPLFELRSSANLQRRSECAPRPYRAPRRRGRAQSRSHTASPVPGSDPAFLL